MNYLTKSIALDLKKLDNNGSFSGYGSVFGVVDQGGDVVQPGAFSKSLAVWKASGRTVPVLWQHKTSEPIGHWPELSEDGYGLLGSADLWLDAAPYARLAHKGMQTKTITGLSIGYRVKEYTYDKVSSVYLLHELDLVEISVVTNPMNDDARVSDVKSLLEAGRLPTLPEYEGFLREAGFSKTQATVLAGRGLKELLSRGEPGGDNSELLSVLQNFTIPH